jgi:MoaA/NifB/PqqE/SkfB family radical SAM enzyme
MLVIVMHNNQEYLEHLAQLAKEEGISDFTIINKKAVGAYLFGGDDSFILSRGAKIEAYEKAFVAVVRGEQKTKQFMGKIEEDSFLERLNMQHKGFICALPFNCVAELQLRVSSKDDKAG